MDNDGFTTEDTKVTVVEVETSLSNHIQHNGEIKNKHHQEVVVPIVAAAAGVSSHCNNAALCKEAKTQCSCATQHRQKVELQAWVHPKGWVLLGTGLCLIAWVIVYFTVTHFYEA